MPFDAVFLSAVGEELSKTAIGTRIDRVHQPQRDVLILQLRGRQGGGKLLINAGGNQSRIHMTTTTTENPAQPPMFCMLLRKHLVGARIAEIRQPPMERLLDFVLECTDEMGEPTRRHLVVELMGRTSNIILLDKDRRIVDCLRRVDFEMSEKRQVLPGLFYQDPPAPDRQNPARCQLETLQTMVEAVEGQKKLDSWLLEEFAGFSPLVCRELAFGFCGEIDCDISELNSEKRRGLAGYLFDKFSRLEGPFEPFLLLADGIPKVFSYNEILQYGNLYEKETAESFSALLDRFYGDCDKADRIRQKTQSMTKTVNNLVSRVSRKLELQKKELEATKDRERMRQLGDIVTANIHNIVRGQTKVTVVDFYHEDMLEIEIPLSVLLSPQQNAAKFYKDYTKAKHAEQKLTELLIQGELEREYLRSILHEISHAEGEKDVQDIREELELGGYLRRQTQKKAIKNKPSRPMEFCSSSGIPIFVGRNNRQNDMLTFKIATKSEIWLHTQKIHGSHVIIASNRPDDQTVTEAAQLAAYYSQARQGQSVPVDFTSVRNVKKPSGAKPGMVIYDNYKTAYVTPDLKLVETLRGK